MYVKIFVFDMKKWRNTAPTLANLVPREKTSHIINHDTTSFTRFTWACKCTRNPFIDIIYIITIAVSIIYILIVMPRRRLFFDGQYLEYLHYFRNYVKVITYLSGIFLFDVTVSVTTPLIMTCVERSNWLTKKKNEKQFFLDTMKTKGKNEDKAIRTSIATTRKLDWKNLLDIQPQNSICTTKTPTFQLFICFPISW